MSRDDAVLLVSRAIAVIQFITALLDVFYLPEYFVSLHHWSVVEGPSAGNTYYVNLDRVEIGLAFGRIAFLLLASWLFWNCGPRISRILMPSPKQQETERQSG